VNVSAKALRALKVSALERFARSSRAQSYTLTAFVADSNGYSLANALVAWASDDTAVATVFDGVVTPVADSGTTTIRATAERRARRPGTGSGSPPWPWCGRVG